MAGTTKSVYLNGYIYKYEYTLSNPHGEIQFNDSAVISFEVEDSFFEPHVKGFITLANPYNGIESEFLFRGDGSDKFKIKLEPEDSSSREKKIDYEFTIVSESNFIDDSSQAKNRKIYYLEHFNNTLLKEAFPYGQRFRGYAGDILKSILKDFNFKVNEEKFARTDFFIDSFPEFVIPALPYRYLDVIYYILKYAYVKEGNIYTKPFLRLDREGRYELKTLYGDYFSKNQELVYESVHSGDLVSTVESNPNNPTSADNFKQFINNVTSINSNGPGIGLSNSYFVNALVTGYNPILGAHKTSKIEISELRDRWSEKFVDTFSATGGKAKKHLNLTQLKKVAEFKKYRLPFLPNVSLAIVEADMVNSFIFYNQQINLNLVGDFGREAGRFTDIFKRKNDNNKGDTLVLGRWFNTITRHIKYFNTLRTEVFCSKSYAGPDYNDEDVARGSGFL